MQTRFRRGLAALVIASVLPLMGGVTVGGDPAGTGPRPTDRPFLWRVDGLAKPSWVYGTIHLPDARVVNVPRAVTDAVDACDLFFAEIPLDPSTQMAMASRLMLPEGRTLKDELPDKLYARLDEVFRSRGLPLATLSRLKIWVITVQVTLLDHIAELASRQPLDAMLFGRAASGGKQVGGLEKVDEQLAVFDDLSTAEQVQMLRKTLDLLAEMKSSQRDLIEEMVVAYVAGDGEQLLALMNQTYDPDDALDRKLIKRLIDDRNTEMTQRILGKLKGSPGTSHFFAVGAAHVVGSTGIVAGLERAGLKLERVVAKP